MKYLLLLSLLSCNVIQSITDGETDVDDQFYERSESDSEDFIVPRDGTYVSDCISEGDGDLDFESTIVVDNGAITNEIEYYDEGLGCGSPLFATEVFRGDVEGGYGEAIIEVESRDITPILIASNLNGLTACGFTDWLDNTSKSVLGCSIFNQTRSFGDRFSVDLEYIDSGDAYIDNIYYTRQ